VSVITEIAILVLAAFVGFEAISKVPNTLHTPLMSGTNAIHGIVLLGGLLLMHEAHGVLEHALLVIAIAFGMINIIGGFVVTDRMLGMFNASPICRRRLPRRRSSVSDPQHDLPAVDETSSTPATSSRSRSSFTE